MRVETLLRRRAGVKMKRLSLEQSVSVLNEAEIDSVCAAVENSRTAVDRLSDPDLCPIGRDQIPGP